jgi:hypothetical protein
LFVVIVLIFSFPVNNFCCVPHLVNDNLAGVPEIRQSLAKFHDFKNELEGWKKNLNREPYVEIFSFLSSPFLHLHILFFPMIFSDDVDVVAVALVARSEPFALLVVVQAVALRHRQPIGSRAAAACTATITWARGDGAATAVKCRRSISSPASRTRV